MFRRRHGVKAAVAGAADTVAQYADLVKDEKLRGRVAAAVAAGLAARKRASRQTGLSGLTRRLAADRVLRAQFVEMVTQLQGAQKRAKKSRSHRLRKRVFFLSGVGLVVAAAPGARNTVRSMIRDRRVQWAPDVSFDGSTPTNIDEQVEVDVPVSTAYNQWTQFEEFPRFMEGVDEVRQLDDTLLHWAATIGGKHAEWDAKIIEQEPDRRITWESTDGKHTRGTVSFEEAGPGRSRVRLHMSYVPERVVEKVGSAVGIDNRRVRGDLQRFRELIESRRVESGAWRGTIKDGNERSEPTGEGGTSTS
jgi:uncharacterized membrane protein